MNVFRLAAAPLLILALAGPPLAAQDAEPEVSLPELQAKPLISDEDRAKICGWIDERVAAIVAEDATDAAQAVRDLRSGFTGTQGFKDAYSTCCVNAIGPIYKKAELIPAVKLLTVLGTQSEMGTHKVLLEALQDDRAGVRQVAARGLRILGAKITASAGTEADETLRALADAGKKETARIPLMTIFAALNVAGGDAQKTLAVLLDLLEVRAEQHVAGKVKAEGADVEGLKTARAVRTRIGALADAEKKRYVVILAKMLRNAIVRYTGGPQPLHKVRDKTSSRQLVQLRNSTELLIDLAESELVALLAPPAPPLVSEKMKTSGAAAPTNMKIEWDKWVLVLQQAVGQKFNIQEADAPDEDG